MLVWATNAQVTEISVETVTVHEGMVGTTDLTGFTTYRVYANFVDADDFVSALFGYDDIELEVNTTTSFFQSDVGSHLGSNVNEAFFAVFPELEYDSWVTIGKDSSTAPGNAIYANEDGSNPFIAPFEAGENIMIDGEVGGLWFTTFGTLEQAPNAYAGEDLKVLVGQFTTDGILSGVLNIQVFLNGDQDQDAEFEGLTFAVDQNAVFGCIDDQAINYNPEANYTDGSCVYEGTLGCTDPVAINFDPNATIDDGSCEYDLIGGCTDPDGCNYDPFVNEDDGSCVYPEEGYDCEGNPFTGCTDPAADNYDPNAIEDDGSCSYGAVDGCSDPTACNYDPLVEVDDGSCVFPEVGFDCDGNVLTGCTDPAAANYNPDVVEDDGSCVYPPSNDDVCDAIPITCGQLIEGLTVNSTGEGDLIGSECTGTEITSPGVWYVYTADDYHQVIVNTCLSVGGDTKLHVFKAAPDCSVLECVAGNDDGCQGSYLSSLAFTVEAEEVFYILVSEFGAGVGLDFMLELNCVDCGDVPENDECVNAEVHPMGGQTVSASICCANPSSAPNFAAGSGTAYDVFYTFNSADFEDIFFDVSNTGSTQIGLAIYQGECGNLTQISGCLVTGTCAGNMGTFMEIPPNTTFTVGVFTTDPEGCGTYNLTIMGLYYGCTDPLADNYDPDAIEDDGSCSYENFIPENDSCAGAVMLTCGSTVEGSTGNTTDTGVPIGLDCNSNPGPGVWYQFSGSGELVELSTCGSVIDTKISVWQSPSCEGPYDCVPAVEGGQGDPSYAVSEEALIPCGFFDQDDAWISFFAEVDSTYYIYVEHQDVDGNPMTPDWGLFTLEVTCQEFIYGCTNEVAYNYNPEATVDDNSCDFFSETCEGGEGTALMLFMDDDFNDGWNGGTYTISLFGGEEVASGSLDDALYTIDEDMFLGADEGFDLLCLQDGCYTITVGGGSFDGEISWFLSIEDVEVISGTSGETTFQIGAGNCGCTDPVACNYDPEATQDDGSCEYLTCEGCMDATACNYDDEATIDNGLCCYENCVYLLMTDDFGDGWNGAVYEVYTMADELIATGSIDDPFVGNGTSEGIDFLCILDGCYYLTVGGGDFDEEIGWTLTGINEGEMIGGAVSIEDQVFFSVGDIPCAFGCTDPEADNYDASAEYDDGSCFYSEECEDLAIQITFASHSDADEIDWELVNEDDEIVATGANYEDYSMAEQYHCLPAGCYALIMNDAGSDGWDDGYITILIDGVTTTLTTLIYGSSLEINVDLEGDCGVENVIEVVGCTDPVAVNWNIEASIDDGSCEYNPDEVGGLPPAALTGEEIVVYGMILPNPVISHANIKLEQLNPEFTTVMELRDISGRLVYQQEFANEQTSLNETIDVSMLAAGIHFVYVFNGESRQVFRLVKQ